jgi:predicted RNA-binding Zn ribbon-like protein
VSAEGAKRGAAPTRERAFSFHRGALSLDFVGTVGGRASDEPEERLSDPAALTAWLSQAGLAEGAAPNAAALARARALREAIHRAASAVLDGRAIDRADLRQVNAAALDLRLGAPQLAASRVAWWTTRAPIAFALARIAADAIEVLSRHGERLARCELAGCGALLLSRSRGERRRWCSMETCGNRAKVAAFRARRNRPAR